MLFESYEWNKSQVCRGHFSWCPMPWCSQGRYFPYPMGGNPMGYYTYRIRGALADNFFRVSMGNPQRGTSESPIPNADCKVSELDIGLQWCLYCLQIDVMMIWDLSRQPPPWPIWTIAIIKDMVVMDAPNVKDCVILSPGSALLFFGHHQEPWEGLYLHEAQAEVMTKTTTWMGQPAHQQVFPITIAEGRWVISMSRAVSEHQDHQFPTETIWRTDGGAQVMSSWTDEDEDGGTCPSSPSVTFVGRRRCSWGWHRIWTPLPHFPGLSHSMNPIQYPPQLNFPPPPLMTPIPLGVPPPPYSLPPPPITALLAPAPLAMQAVAPPVQANVVNAPIPITQPVVNPVAPAAALVLVAGGAPDPSPPPPPGSEPGSMVDFDNMSVSGSSTTSASSVQGRAPHPQVSTGGFHLPALTSLTDTMAYEMWKNTIGFFHLSGCTDKLIMPITYQSIKGDVALDIVTHGPHMNLCKLIAWLNNNFGVMSDEDTDERIVHHQARYQGICEALWYPDWLCNDEVGCSISTHHAHWTRKRLGRPTFLAGYVLTLSPLWPGKCAWMEANDRWPMRKSRMLPDGLSKGRTLACWMTHLWGRMQPQPHRMMGNGIRMDNPIIIRVSHSMGARQGPPITVGQLWEQSTWKTLGVTALMVQMAAI